MTTHADPGLLDQLRAAGPYKGLAPFDDSDLDALLFFGRELERDVIEANLFASRLTVLYGQTAVGKTSLLRAGLVHALRDRAQRNRLLRGHPDFAVVLFDRWNGEPVVDLGAATHAALVDLFGEDIVEPPRDEPLADTLDRWTRELDSDVLLVLDQAEEYFLYHHAGQFEAELPELVTRPLRVNVLLSLREDQLAKLDRFKGRIPNLFANYLRVDHLDPRAATAAIRRPLERYNELTGDAIEIEPALVDAILEQTLAGKVDLGRVSGVATETETGPVRVEAAYLQLVLQRLWTEERTAGSRVLRLETLTALGGAEEIARTHLERALEELDDAGRDVAASVFLHLVTPSGTKIALPVGDLAEYAKTPAEQLEPVLHMLARERILKPVETPSADTANGSYEIFHDVLGEAVLAWRAQHTARRALERERRRHRRAIAVATVSLIALAAVTAVALFALVQRENAQDAARRARARELAARANVFLTTDAARSLALAAQAARLEPSPAVERQLRDALIASRVRRVFEARGGPVADTAVSPDGRRLAVASTSGWIRVFDPATARVIAEFRHPGGVRAVDFSRDRNLLVSAGPDGTARFWNPDDARPLGVVRHRGAVTSIALARDGLTLVTGSSDSTATVWNVVTGDRVAELPMPGPVSIVRFSPAGDRVAVVSGGAVRLFDPTTGRVAREFTEPGTIAAIDFSANGRLLATANFDKTARIWGLYPVVLQHRLSGHRGRVVDVAFSPRGTLLATASTDGTARVWQAGRGVLAGTLLGHRNYVNSVRFSGDGFFIVTSSRDETSRVWNAQSGRLLSLLSGHDATVTRATFLRNGNRVLTRSEDGTVRIWDAGTEPELREVGRHGAPVVQVSFGVGGGTLLSAGADGSARLWRQGRLVRTIRHGAELTDALVREDIGLLVTTGVDGIARLWPLAGGERRELRHGARINAVGVSRDGKRAATAGQDGVVRVWDLATGNTVQRLRQRGPVLDVAFDPTSARLATAGADRIARIWDGGSVQHELRGHRDDVVSVAFSPGGGLLVTASLDHDARVWNTRAGELVRTLEGHFSALHAAAFSSDARWIVTAGGSTAALWEVRSERSFFLRGHQGQVFTATFAPGGFQVATGGEDGTVRTYSCEICGDIPALLPLAGRRLAETRPTKPAR